MTVSPDRNANLFPRDRGIILILLIAAFVVILNETIMNVALPRLMTELKVSASTVQWLATAFMLTMAMIIPTTGFILQRFSTRLVFLAAMGLFCVGTLLAGIAPNFELLLAGRIVQASGTALMLPGGLLMGLAAPSVGRLFDRYDPLPLAIPGAALLTLTLWGFTTVTAATPVGLLLTLHLTFSLGLALLFTPVMTGGLNPLPGHLYSHGSAIMSTLQMVAGAIGTALLVTVMTTRTASLQGLSPEMAQTAGLQAAFALAAGIALLAFALSFFLRRGTGAGKHDTHAATPAQASD